MDFTVALYLERIPGATVRDVRIAGIDQKCLCIPIDEGVLGMTKRGLRFLQITLKELQQMHGSETHSVYFSYPDRRASAKANKHIKSCGRCSLSRDYNLNKDKTVKTTFVGYGVISLDDIPKDAISESPSGKRMLRIMVKPMAEKDRGDNDLIIAVDPRFGADKGRRESLLNGFDAPLAEVGRMKHHNPETANVTGSAITINEDLQQRDQEDTDRRIGGYRL